MNTKIVGCNGMFSLEAGEVTFTEAVREVHGKSGWVYGVLNGGEVSPEDFARYTEDKTASKFLKQYDVPLPLDVAHPFALMATNPLYDILYQEDILVKHGVLVIDENCQCQGQESKFFLAIFPSYAAIRAWATEVVGLAYQDLLKSGAWKDDDHRLWQASVLSVGEPHPGIEAMIFITESKKYPERVARILNLTEVGLRRGVSEEVKTQRLKEFKEIVSVLEQDNE